LRIGKLADEMLSILADVEAGIDFVEEDIELFDRSEARKKIERQLAILNELLADAALSRPFREGYRVALTGPVNAGKSSIFNRITGETRAIVTEIPGTTRDVLREPVIMEGLLFLFQDTAGLRDQIGDRVEAIGVNLAKGAIEAADIVVFVLDSSITLCKETMAGIENLPRSNSIVALNKKDLPVAVTVGYFAELLPGFCTVAVSAKTGEGFGGLRQALLECAGKERISRIANERVILNARLISLLREARDESRSFADLLKSGAPLEILAVAIRSVLHNYEEALGRRYSENLLANIFSRFCIGK
jgi:tRNA modification GTPase